MYSSRLGETKLNPWRDGVQNLLFLVEEALLPMSISAIVPVWNGRDLLERLLATLASADAARPPSCWWWTTARPTARRSWRGRAARA